MTMLLDQGELGQGGGLGHNASTTGSVIGGRLADGKEAKKKQSKPFKSALRLLRPRPCVRKL